MGGIDGDGGRGVWGASADTTCRSRAGSSFVPRFRFFECGDVSGSLGADFESDLNRAGCSSPLSEGVSLSESGYASESAALLSVNGMSAARDLEAGSGVDVDACSCSSVSLAAPFASDFAACLTERFLYSL